MLGITGRCFHLTCNLLHSFHWGFVRTKDKGQHIGQAVCRFGIITQRFELPNYFHVTKTCVHVKDQASKNISNIKK